VNPLTCSVYHPCLKPCWKRWKPWVPVPPGWIRLPMVRASSTFPLGPPRSTPTSFRQINPHQINSLLVLFDFRASTSRNSGNRREALVTKQFNPLMFESVVALTRIDAAFNRDPHQHKSKLSKSRWHPTSQDGAQSSIDAREEGQDVFTCRKVPCWRNW
jgi:hypothetical protein